MDLKKLIQQIKSFKAKHIIFTWWEPTLFQKQLLEIQKKIWDWYTYEIETNWSKEIVENLNFNQINISPKLSNSWNKKYNLSILNSKLWINNWILDLKFVSDWNDLNEIQDYVKNIQKKYYINWIYIMPLWTTQKSQNNKKILKFCIENWYNYCLRQHIILFGNKKWV